MKPDEIKKVLECCSEHEGCHNCPCKKECGDLSVVTTEALNLINRQKAKIDRLETVLSEKLFCITQLKGENFALTNERDAYKNLLKNAKTEAVKECTELLIDKAEHIATWSDCELAITISEIKDTAKELVGE